MEEYVVREWSPSCSGQDVGQFDTIEAAAKASDVCYSAQILNLRTWDPGYVVRDETGQVFACSFLGEVPKDAQRLVSILKEQTIEEMS